MNSTQADPLDEIDVDLSTQSLLLAAANHDVNAVKGLLKTTPATVQDADTGYTPLHAAIASCEEDPDEHVNGNANGKSQERRHDLEVAAETVSVLLGSGAIWNDLDLNNETPGCIALRLGLDHIYQLVVDAGVRAELLLTKLSQYNLLGDTSEDDDEDSEEEARDEDKFDAAGALLGEQDGTIQVDPSANNTDYLRDDIAITDSNILDSAANGVMMSWETPIMERHAQLLLPSSGLRVLNIGHGMGIIDDFFQTASPSSHHIIEAHPAVLAKMKAQGWHKKPGVVIHEGRWQDVLEQLVLGGESGQEVIFDAIYFDTFAEDYSALREFFSEYVVQMLDPNGRFGFFNGMGADRQVCYDVYNKVVELDLFEAGLDVEWEDESVPDLNTTKEWSGVKRPYWTLKTYKLPTCRFTT